MVCNKVQSKVKAFTLSGNVFPQSGSGITNPFQEILWEQTKNIFPPWQEQLVPRGWDLTAHITGSFHSSIPPEPLQVIQWDVHFLG